MYLQELKSFKVRNNDLDVLVHAHSELTALAKSFDDLKIETPDWLLTKQVEVDDEVKSLMKAERQAALKKLELRRAALATPDEKRQALDAEIAALKSQM